MNTKDFNFKKRNNIRISGIHFIHKYTAKVIPHIPNYFIKKFTKKEDLVLDPFCGSGTSLLEARILCRNAVGFDINPLAVLISKVKTTPIDPTTLSQVVERVKKELYTGRGRCNVEFPNIEYWFSENARNDLARIKYVVEKIGKDSSPAIYNFLLVCFASIIRKSSFADNRMPKTYKSKRVTDRISRGWQPSPLEYFETVLDINYERANEVFRLLNKHNAQVSVFSGDANDLGSEMRSIGLPVVDFIITSPPYINAQDYFRSYKLELWWTGLSSYNELLSLNKLVIGTERISGYTNVFMPWPKLPDLSRTISRLYNKEKNKAHLVLGYFNKMERVIQESFALLKGGGYFCLVTGNNTIGGLKIPTFKIFITFAERIGFKVACVYKDKIKQRTLAPSRNHGAGFIKDEWVVLLKKR